MKQQHAKILNWKF